MTEHQREAECVSYCLTMKMDKDQGKKKALWSIVNSDRLANPFGQIEVTQKNDYFTND